MLPTDYGLGFINPSHPAARVVPALLITSVFGIFGFLSRGVTLPGAIAGSVSAFLIYLGLGFGGFVTLFSVFAITWLTTRTGYSRKRALGLAEDPQGRDARQVLANVAVGALFAVLALRFGHAMACAAVAALAEAAADTASSEVGEASSGRAWLITSLKRVEPGTNGGISFPGTLAAIVAALAVATCARVFHVIPSLTAAAVAGVLGTLVDSWLGATVERQGWIGNNGVNFLSTLSAALIAIALAI